MASIAPLASLARQVAGSEGDVLTLVPPGASEHTWEPAPRDVEKLSRARVFLEVGLGFESWARKLLDANAPDCVTIDASRGVDLIEENGEHAAFNRGTPVGPQGKARAAIQGDAANHALQVAEERAPEVVQGTATKGANPHYWLDPISLEGSVTQLVEVLARLDSEHSSDYRARGRDTCAKLYELDAEIRERTSRFSSRKLLTFHEAWDYFARSYGLEIVGSIEQFPGKEPGPRHVVQVVRLAQNAGIRAVFAEPQSPTKAAEVIAAECGIPMLLLDPLGGEGVPGRSDYFSLMRYNVDVMEKALR